MTEPRSCLAPFAASMRDPDPVKARMSARAAYHTIGLVLIDPAWITSWAERQALRNLADKIHGPRPKGVKHG